MQFIAQDLSPEDKEKGTGCNQKNLSANDFEPQDWTGRDTMCNHFHYTSCLSLIRECLSEVVGIFFKKKKDVVTEYWKLPYSASLVMNKNLFSIENFLNFYHIK